MRISKLEKRAGDFFLTLDHWVIREPGIYGLIGPNGCGKSATAKLIAGLLSPDRGEIDLEGIASRDMTLLSRKPYMMEASVYQNLIYPLKLRGVHPDPGRCRGILSKIGLENRQKQRARSLSAGEQQKLAVMRALIFEPKLVIIDEALTDLDIDSLDMFETMIREIQKTRPIIWLLISHQLSHIRRLCEYIFFMARGRLEAQGSPENLLLRPENPLVRAYLKHETL
jgi:ABC-type multidrug transport system ATPase subunit